MIRTLIILLISHSAVIGSCKQKKIPVPVTFWLPTKMVQYDPAYPDDKVITTFSYDTQHRITGITKTRSNNQMVFTALIDYSEAGWISSIKETSTNPSIPGATFQFEYTDGVVSSIKMTRNSRITTTRVTHDKAKNSYILEQDQTRQVIHFDEDNNLKKIQMGMITMLEIYTRDQKGVFQHMVMQPALLLAHHELQATSSLAMFMYHTYAVSAVAYDDEELLAHSWHDEYGNIAKVILHTAPKEPICELIITYEDNEMKI